MLEAAARTDTTLSFQPVPQTQQLLELGAKQRALLRSPDVLLDGSRLGEF